MLLNSRLVRLTAVLGLLLSFVFVANLSAATPTTDIQICVQLQGARPGAGQGEPGLQWQLRNGPGGTVMYSNTTSTDNQGCFSATGVPGQFYYLWARSADSIAMERQLVNPWPTSGTIDLRTAAAGSNALILREGNANGSDNAINFGDLIIFSPTFNTTNPAGDFDESGGLVNFGDLLLFSPNFGLTGTAGHAAPDRSKPAAPQTGTFVATPSGYACPSGSAGERTVQVAVAFDLTPDVASSAQIWFDVAPASSVESVALATSPFGTTFANNYNTTTGRYEYAGAQLGSNVGSVFTVVFNVVVAPSAPALSTVAVNFVLGTTIGNFDGTQFGTPDFRQVFVTGNNTSIGVVCPSAVGFSTMHTAGAGTGMLPLLLTFAAALTGSTLLVARRKR